jgi:hypothetical protein
VCLVVVIISVAEYGSSLSLNLLFDSKYKEGSTGLATKSFMRDTVTSRSHKLAIVWCLFGSAITD